ncbi:hypothetical protein [Mycobacterium attenuatum]|uniref:hypothetical protein n=1 Tax=Mycobacterium attenuatum TaxID=2341086 RepID=UPI0010A95F84|nr:hypothetical protein [Mycobacterium attenuatum]
MSKHLRCVGLLGSCGGKEDADLLGQSSAILLVGALHPRRQLTYPPTLATRVSYQDIAEQAAEVHVPMICSP